MRGATLSIVIVILAPASAFGESKIAHMRLGQSKISNPIDAQASFDASSAVIKGRIDAFDRRITLSSKRALRSICAGCEGKKLSVAQPPSRASKTATVDPDVDDGYRIDRADEAGRDSDYISTSRPD